jgi:hypothetical protein
MNEKTFLDGCHKYGWIVNIIVTVAIGGAAWGSMSTRIDDYGKRIVRIEDFLLGAKK